MTHYQKITAILIRAFCLIGFLFGIVGFGYSIMIGVFTDISVVQIAQTFYASIFFLI